MWASFHSFKTRFEPEDAGRRHKNQKVNHASTTPAEKIPPTDQSKPPQVTNNRLNKPLPLPGTKPRPGLALDTSVARLGGRMPQQVYPVPGLTSRAHEDVVNLDDIKALSQQGNRAWNEHHGNSPHARPGPQKLVTGSYTRQSPALQSACALMDEAPPPPHKDGKPAKATDTTQKPQFVLQDPPKAKRNDNFHRPPPLQLSTNVSPSDRAIPIGIAIPSAAIQDHNYNIESAAPRSESPLREQSSQGYGQVLNTPTIVITPAEEDFEASINSMSRELRPSSYRPRSSVYSRYTNGLSKSNQQDATPPVPPLPSFALVGGSVVRGGETRNPAFPASQVQSRPKLKDKSLSICTVFEEDGAALLPSATSPTSNRLSPQPYIPTPRRSRGWWNVITSPFSASSASRSFFSPSSPIPEEEQSWNEPLNSGVARSDNTVFPDRLQDDHELRSAPPTECSRQTFLSRTIPITKRSDTAPGALDMGNADAVNIYRTPNQGLASSYYDRSRNYPSFIATSATGTIDRGFEEGWNPSHRIYGEPFGASPQGAHPLSRGLLGMQTARQHSGTDDTDFPDAGLMNHESVPTTVLEQRRVISPNVFFANRGYEESPTASPSHGDASHGNLVMKHTKNTIWDNNLSPNPTDEDMVHTSRICPSEGDSVRPYPPNVTKELKWSDYDVDGRSFPAPFSSDILDSATTSFAEAQKSVFTGKGTETTLVENENQDQSYRGGQIQASDEKLAEEFQETPSTTGSHQPHRSQPDLSPTSTTPVLETARSARFVGTHSLIDDMKDRDFERKLQPMAPVRTPGSESKCYPSSFDVADDWSEAQSAEATEPISEKRAQPSFAAGGVKTRNVEYSAKRTRSLYPRLLGVAAGSAALLLVILIVLLVLFIPFHQSDMPVQAEWLNLTGFPPLPTGVATVVGAKSAKDVNGCVKLRSLWSCAVPAANQGLSTTQPDELNFRFMIRFRKGTLLPNETLPESTNNPFARRDSGRAANAAALVKRSAWSNYLYTSSPPPPSTADQIFLGQTTDNVTLPFNGEETPFYISLLDPVALQPIEESNLRKRHFRYPYPTPSDFNSSNSTSDDPNPGVPKRPAEAIPLPNMQSNGEALPPELYPFAYAQPLRLFNRGLENEHYGFYTYFDRSIYVSGLSNTSLTTNSTAGDAVSSNVRLNSATAVCTWSQSRLLVQIWTRKLDVTSLGTVANSSSIPAVNSTANDMKSPGSFPYAVTITLDRHGGEASKKGVYCFGLDENHRVVPSVGRWITENRAFGGKIVNPAETPTSAGLNRRDDIQGDGIDGGTSGCECQWQNFSPM